ncbi:MAG: ZIP family metal transporter [Candidatus Omnitrophica bacterium]|nr:ZIP family metal transporter [Candidatus Omnitrophota bacterium]MCM8790932.1 ZIP family metal transporter [Candidatus Omnitrophota bacterium]
MIEILKNAHPALQALMAGCFTWFLTAVGAAIVLLSKTFNRKLLDASLGFAGGVMLAASFWSLLVPAIELSGAYKSVFAVIPAAGFAAGVIFIRIFDRLLPHLHIYLPVQAAEGIKTSWKKGTLIVLAMTIHNIPEGLVIGVAFAALAQGMTSATLAATMALVVGIGLQDIPEGIAVSMPLYSKGMSRYHSFWYGQLSGVAEPLAAVIGALAVTACRPLLPYAMAFAAGAMIFVVIEEIIPESQYAGNSDIASMGTMLGFVGMMLLEIGL